MSLELMLIGAQLGSSLLTTGSQNSVSRSAQRVEEGQIDLAFKQYQLQATQQAANDARDLRMTLSSNMALMGARGQMTGVGSALAIQNDTLSNYGTDKQMLQMNTNYRKNEAKLQKLASGLNTVSTIQERSAKAAGSLLDSTSFNVLQNALSGKKTLDKKPKESFVKQGGY